MPTQTITELRVALGPDNVLTDPSLVRSYASEWTGRFTGTADVVALPRNVAEVVAVVSTCAESATPVVPRGGGTGLVGGAMPESGWVVIDLRRLADLSIDSDARVATAGVGVTIADLAQLARAHRLTYAVDLASRSSATVGGTIATNAGGLRVLRNGDTRAQLVGIEAVLANGTVVSHLPGVTRDNTGYHLPSLLCGSEGTLAVITAAQLRLVAAPAATSVVLLGFESTAAAVRAAWELAADPLTSAVELVRHEGVDLVTRATGLPRPFGRVPHSALLVELSSSAGPIDVQPVVESLSSVTDVAVGLDATSASRLWAYRDRHTEAIATLGPAYKFDVTLPSANVINFIEEVGERVAAAVPEAKTWLFGHVADGNVHVNVTGARPDDDALDDLVLTMVVDAGGSISTEHGIGRAKLPWLHLARSSAELGVFRALKTSLDPDWLLNPGVLVPAE